MAQAPATVAQVINALYVGLYADGATGAGLAYWAGTVGLTVAQAEVTPATVAQETSLGQGFVNSQLATFTATYGAMNDIQFIEQLYTNAAGSTGGFSGGLLASGIQYWYNLLQQAEASGQSVTAARAGIVGQFFDNILSYDLTVGQPASGLSPADYAAAVSIQQSLLAKITVSQYLSDSTQVGPGAALAVTAIPSANYTAEQALIAATTPSTVAAIEAAIAASAAAGNLNAINAYLASVVAGSSFNLTPGIDTISNYTNVYGSLTPFLNNGIGPTLNTGDNISNVTNLYITDQNGTGIDIIPVGATLANIANIILNTAGNAGIGAGQAFDTSGITGVANLTVTSGGAGTDWVNASGTTAITITHNNQTASATGGAVFVSGGGNVTVTDAGSSTTKIVGVKAATVGTVVGSTLGVLGLVPSAAMLPTGTVTVTDTNVAGGSVDVMGGTAVTVNVTASTNTGVVDIGNTAINTGNSLLGGATNPTGVITVTDLSSVAGTITVFGGSNVNVTAAGTKIVVGDATGKLLSNQATGAVVITNLLTNTFNGLAPANALMNASYLTQIGSGAPIAVNNATAGGTITENGSTTVTVTTNTGAATTIGTDSTILGSLATGAIMLTDMASNLNNTFAIGGYWTDTIVGGSTVTVSEAGANIFIGSFAGTTANNVADNPTGAVKVTETVASHSFVVVDGGNGVTVNAQGQNVLVGAFTGTAGAQVITEASVFSGNGIGGGNGAITDDGGTTVTVNTTGGNVAVGSAAVGNGTVQVPTGAVSITDTFSGANTANGDAYAVLGGTTVTITATNTTSGNISVGAAPVLNGAGTALTNAIQDPTGNVTINNSVTNGATTTYGNSYTTVYTNGATTVSITGGAAGATIADVNSFATVSATPVGTSSLATVNLTGIGNAVQIDSNALANLSISSSLTGMAFGTYAYIQPLAGFTALPASALALTLGGDTNTGTGVYDPTATSITVTTSGATADNINLSAAKATSFVFNNAAAVTVTNPFVAPYNDTMSATGPDTITAMGAGALTLGDIVVWGGASKITSINGSTATGAITVTFNSDTTSVIGGSGNDVVTAEVTIGLNGNAAKINGGAGTNEVILTNIQSLYDPILFPNTPVFQDFTNFQVLGLAGAIDGQPGASGTYDVSGGWMGVIVSGSGGALNLINAAAGETLTFTGASTGATTWTLKTDTPADVLSLTLSGVTQTLNTAAGAAGGIETVNITDTGTNALTLHDLAGVTKTITVAGSGNLTLTDTDATATTINASASSGKVDVHLVKDTATGVNITGGSGLLTVNLENNVAATTANTVDLVTTGSGGGVITIGTGNGGWYNGGAWNGGFTVNSGSETINLTASAAVRDTIIAPATELAGTGSQANIIGFQNYVSGARGADDVVTIGNASTIIANNASVGAVIDADTYAISNGIFTLLTGAPTGQQELTDVQDIIGLAGGNIVGAVQIAGATYVVMNNSSGTFQGQSILQLSGVTGITGFSYATDLGAAKVNTSSGNTIGLTDVTLLSAGNTGSAVASTAFNDSGFAIDSYTAAAAAGITNTYNNLANFAQLNVAGVAGGSAVTNQVGTGTELILNVTGAATLGSFTYSGGALTVDNSAGALVITSLVDAAGTDLTIWLDGTNSTTIGGIVDAALTTINASNTTVGSITLGQTVALSQAGLTVTGGTGLLTVTASGAGDTITGATTNAAGDIIVANGAGDTINDTTGFITANGIGDHITTTGNESIFTTGTGDVYVFKNASNIFLAGNGAGTIGIGNGSSITWGTGGTETAYLTGDLTGTTSAGVTAANIITLSAPVHGSDNVVLANTWSGGTLTETVANGTLANSQVNVALATSLANALDIAAATAALSQQSGGGGNPAGVIAAHTGVIDWFQYGGNTYIVEANNSTTAAATHTALAASDEVIKITGLVDLSTSGASFNAGTHTIQF